MTADTGGGHVKAAQALMHQSEKQIPGCKSMLVDSLKFISPAINKIITGTYHKTIKSAPFLYGKLYDLSEDGDFITDIAKAFNGLLSGRLNKLFMQYRFDAAVCAHTIPLQMLASLKRRGLLNIPVIGLVTDYAHHSFWNVAEADAFIVAHEDVKKDMVKMGIDEEKVFAFGIPVAEEFLKPGNRYVLLNKMGFKDKPTLLLMGGSLGFGEMLPLFSALISIARDIQIIAVAGHNKKLKYQMENIVNKRNGFNSSNIRIFGYTDKISELMDIADIIITKPGGITVSEALVKNLPIIITRPIPGQEERNARFLTQSGAAVRLHSCSELENILQKMLDRPFTLRRMSKAAGKLARPNASVNIARLLEEFVMKAPYSERVNLPFPVAISAKS